MYRFLSPGTLLHGRYRIVRPLGGGGMGAVYLADDVRTPGFQVAVKEMRTESEAAGEADSPEGREERAQALASFEREAEILKPLTHPNLPVFSDSFEESGRPYLVMEFVPGESLEKKLDRLNGKPMAEREALYYGIQAARVLRYLHAQQPPIIFRDVKPANLMVMPNYQLKLIDFGIARKYKVGQSKDTVTMGTAAYAPFEQFGKNQTDRRSDVYSLAATLYHLLTGRPPTPATTPTGLRDHNPLISPDTEALIIRAMDRDMAKRPQDTREMEQELRQCYGIPFEEPKPLAPPAPGAGAAPAGPGGAAPGPRLVPGPLPPPAERRAPPVTTPAVLPPPLPAVPVPPPPVAPVPPVVPLPRPAPTPVAGVPAPAAPAGTGSRPAAAPAPAPPVVPAGNGQRASHQPGCPHCGHLNKPGARFCGNCGASLVGRPTAILQILGPRSVLWERRIAANENPFLIGRRSLSRHIFPHIDLTYSDPAAYISRRHAQIVADPQGYSLEDLGSENGTFLNDNRIPANQPLPLHNGDMIQVGKVQMRFGTG